MSNWFLIKLSSNEGSDKPAQMCSLARAINCSHTLCMDVADENIDLAPLDTSARAFKEGFWAYAINNKNS